MELKITKERVLEAAKSCPTARGVLEQLFPDVFREKCFSIGQHFLVKKDGFYGGNTDEVFILAMTGNKPTDKPVIRLIGIETGMKLYEDPILYDWAPNAYRHSSQKQDRKVRIKERSIVDRLIPVTVDIIVGDVVEVEEL